VGWAVGAQRCADKNTRVEGDDHEGERCRT
jgi:hypothetical protein